MIAIYSDKHLLHSPKTYFQQGRIQNYPEQPQRACAILDALVRRRFEIKCPTDYGIDPILQVHSKEYVNYFSSAYNDWVNVIYF